MTTIISDGIEMASDSLTCCNFKLQGVRRKIFRLKNGAIIGFCGESTTHQPVINWLNGGPKPEFKKSEFSALILEKCGILSYIDQELHPEMVCAPYAIGTGCEFAMGAYLAGATLKKSVEIAIKLDKSSGLPVKVVRV